MGEPKSAGVANRRTNSDGKRSRHRFTRDRRAAHSRRVRAASDRSRRNTRGRPRSTSQRSRSRHAGMNRDSRNLFFNEPGRDLPPAFRNGSTKRRGPPRCISFAPDLVQKEVV